MVRVERLLQLAPDARTPHADAHDRLADDGEGAGVGHRLHGDENSPLLSLSQLENAAGADVVSGLDLDSYVVTRLAQLLHFNVELDLARQFGPSERTIIFS